jgi:hypothetical protein
VQLLLTGPTTPGQQRLHAVTLSRFRLSPLRSPLLGGSRLLSLPPGTEMFQFPGLPLPALCVQTGVTRHDPCQVSPFGHPRIKARLAATRGLSQPPTSFIGFWRLGIHHVPFVTWQHRKDARARYAVLKVPDPAHLAAWPDAPAGSVGWVDLGRSVGGPDGPGTLRGWGPPGPGPDAPSKLNSVRGRAAPAAPFHGPTDGTSTRGGGRHARPSSQ